MRSCDAATPPNAGKRAPGGAVGLANTLFTQTSAEMCGGEQGAMGKHFSDDVVLRHARGGVREDTLADASRAPRLSGDGDVLSFGARAAVTAVPTPPGCVRARIRVSRSVFRRLTHSR